MSAPYIVTWETDGRWFAEVKNRPGRTLQADGATRMAAVGGVLELWDQSKPGDRARLTKIPDSITDPDMRDLFAQCVGHVFPVGDISDTLIELEIGERFGRASHMESIYVEHDCVEIVKD
jgi:hypothetical protein